MPAAAPRFLNTILLGGSTIDKLAAARAAGFDAVELWRQDLEAFDGGPAELAARLRDTPLGLVDYQVLMDFDGAPAEQQADKRAEAIALLDTTAQLGADTLLVPASTAVDCDPDRIVDDLRWLADEAASRKLRIAYEPMAWSTVHVDSRTAWALLRELDRPNVGLVVDAFHLFSIGGTVADLAGIPADRVYLVQLSDLGQDLSGANRRTLIVTARHERLLPGEGQFPLDELREWARRIGYAGPVGVEVFNDAWNARPPVDAAMAAMQALKAVWPD
jgi:4-hydroxyphenylpyruvate dioxygenase